MTVILIDGKNAIYRFAWTGRNLTSDSGQPTGAILGLLNCLLSFSRKFHDSKFVVCWDGVRSRQSWRAQLFPAYKQARATRVMTPEQQENSLRMDMNWQTKKVKELFRLLSIAQIEDPDTEADDLVAILAEQAKQKGWRSVVYTNDHDYMQLLARGIIVTSSASEPAWNEKLVQEKFRCRPADVLKIRALLGDKSDGIPRAVPGVGEVAAAKYVALGVDPSLEAFVKLPRAVRMGAVKLEAYWPTVHMNYRLMRLPVATTDAEIPTAVAASLTREVRRVMKELTAVPTRSRADYTEFLRMLAEFGLLSVVGNRSELWAVQK